MFAPSSLSLLLLLSLTMPLCFSLYPAPQTGGASVELWCVAKNNADDTALQNALNWACGSGGADCNPIQQGRSCYSSGDILKAASFAFNDYYRKHRFDKESCEFGNTAALTTLNPSYGSCRFPSSFSVNNGGLNGSIASTVAGTGADNVDTSGCSQVGSKLGWIFITMNLLIIMRLILLR